MTSSPKEFPASEVLGYSLDFTQASPTDIKSVLAAVKKGRRVLAYEPNEDTRKLQVEGAVYNVPRCMGITDYNSSDGNYITFKTGTEAANSLKVDASLSVRYLAVSASASASYSIDKTYKTEDQWALYSFNSDTYLASLKDYYDMLAESNLLKRLKEMTPIEDGSNMEVVQEWKSFFSSWGSHVIINASFGARFQLNVWASNSSSEVNEKFSTSVQAAFEGVSLGVSVDVSVKKEDSYKTFSEYMQKTVSVVGGNQKMNKTLTADPSAGKAFKEWAGSVSEESSITSLNVVELWLLMSEANKKEIRAAAAMVEDAYNYIVQHPLPHKTAVVLDIQSDWAEFNLLSPHAIIIPDDGEAYPEKTVATRTRVQWGREYSHTYERKTLRFSVVNDGSPIDFSISHGSNGSQPGKGRAEVLMERATYLNDENPDNVWNTKWYYQKPVSKVAAYVRPELTRKAHKWGEALKSYLEA